MEETKIVKRQKSSKISNDFRSSSSNKVAITPSKASKSVILFLVVSVFIASSAASTSGNYVLKRTKRSPQEFYRNAVMPDLGGKVPESYENRIEFNKIDSVGLAEPVAQELSNNLKDAMLEEVAVGGPVYRGPGGHGYEVPTSHYGKPTYLPPKPKEPVLLPERPYEVKEIRPVPITLKDTYTSFDCRKAPYPDRHYADPEAGCTIYHFCHGDGKQDTFHCPYGTIFNEYLGTCDHSEAVYCKGGEGYKGPAPHHHEAPYHQDPYHHEAPHHGGYSAPHHGGYAPPHHEGSFGSNHFSRTKPVYRQPPPYKATPKPYHAPRQLGGPTRRPTFAGSDPFAGSNGFEQNFNFPKRLPGFNPPF